MERKSLGDILRSGERDAIASAWQTTEAAKEFAPLPAGTFIARIISGELLHVLYSPQFAAASGTPFPFLNVAPCCFPTMSFFTLPDEICARVNVIVRETFTTAGRGQFLHIIKGFGLISSAFRAPESSPN